LQENYKTLKQQNTIFSFLYQRFYSQADPPKIQPTSIARRDKRYFVIAIIINAAVQSILNIKPKHANT
jgi:hypothetical protein